MSRSTSWVRLASQCLALALSVCACAKPPLSKRSWFGIETEHFQLLTDTDSGSSAELARDFERFHTFMQLSAEAVSLEARLPTLIFVFSDQETYDRFGILFTSGFFRSTPRGNYLVIGGNARSAKRIAFHEYSHFLLHARGLHPVWYDEGYAELVSTARFRGASVELGEPPPRALRLVRGPERMSIASLLTSAAEDGVRDLKQQASFYASSWALLHFLYSSRGSTQGPDRWAQKDRFLALFRDGIAARQAFETAFETDLETLDRELQAYLEAGPHSWELPIEPSAPPLEPSVRRVSPAEALTRLGDLKLRLEGTAADAATLLERALELDPRVPRARALLGSATSRLKRHAEAEDLFARAVAEEPDSAWNHLEYGEFLLTRTLARNQDIEIVRTDLPADQALAYLQRARRELERAIELDPRIPDSYAQLALSYLSPGESPEQALAYAQRAFALRSGEMDGLLLAEALVAAGRTSEARPLLQGLRAQASRGSAAAEYLDHLLKRAEGQTE